MRLGVASKPDIRQRNTSGLRTTLLSFLVFMSATLAAPERAYAKVLLAKDEALALAFPTGVEVRERGVLLTAAQKDEIQTKAETNIPSNLFHYYEGHRGDEITGYAVIDSRIMRSNQAVFMVVLSKQLIVQKVVILAFNEPSEYQPPDAWLDHLTGEKQISDLIPGQGIPPIAGSTLSAQGVSDGVRAVRASIEVVLGKKD
jgi:hypothetical protein